MQGATYLPGQIHHTSSPGVGVHNPFHPYVRWFYEGGNLVRVVSVSCGLVLRAIGTQW